MAPILGTALLLDMLIAVVCFLRTHFFPAAPMKRDLINSLLVNVFSRSADKWATPERPADSFSVFDFQEDVL